MRVDKTIYIPPAFQCTQNFNAGAVYKQILNLQCCTQTFAQIFSLGTGARKLSTEREIKVAVNGIKLTKSLPGGRIQGGGAGGIETCHRYNNGVSFNGTDAYILD